MINVTAADCSSVTPAIANTHVPVAQLRYQHHVNVANAE